ncbi:MAG: O-antigen ligase family protein [Acidimicrobiales bacterium]
MTLVKPTGAPPSAGGTPPRRGSEWVGIVVALGLVTLSVLGLSQFGSKAVYITVGVAAAVWVLWSIRDLIGPPIADAVRRLSPTPTGVPALGKVRTSVGAAVAALAAGTLAFAVAGAGTKVMYALVALVGLTAGAWLLWPAILLLFNTPADGQGLHEDHLDELAASEQRSRTREHEWTAIGLGLEPGPKPQAGRTARAVGMLLAVVAAGMLAFFSATMGSKALLALVGGVIVVGCLLRARDKTLFTVFGLGCSLAFLVHKSFGPLNDTIASGAPSVYITSFDAMLLLLYALWVTEGTFVADVRAALHRRILWIPLIGALLMLPSLLAGGASVRLGLSELVRMSWMYLLFFYVAVRVRSRTMVWAILAGLGAFAIVEIVVVILQWKTGGVLGLSFLGVPTQLNQRITDTSELGRPFGTIIHPDFMGAAMGSLGLLAFALGLTLRRSLTKVVALAFTVGCILCLYLAHTRAALVGLVIVLFGMLVVAIVHRHLQWRTIGRVVLALMIASAIFFPQLQARFAENFGTGHFSEEVTSRYQLNDVAGEMFFDHPIIGVGLNNFQGAMGPYEVHGVIFIDNPVQNLYLLYLSETGIIGMAGFLVVGISMYNVALRLARSRDRLLGGVGLGVSAAMAFLMIEELLGFALREDVPLSVYWIFAGLSVACYRMAGLEGQHRLRMARPGGRPDGADPGRYGGGPSRRGTGVPIYAPGASPSAAEDDKGNGRANRAVGSDHARSGPDLPARYRPALNPGGSGRPPWARRGPSRWSPAGHRRVRGAVLAWVLVLGTILAAEVPGLSGAQASSTPPAPTPGAQERSGASSSVPIPQMRVVFAADRNTDPGAPGTSGIFVANADGTDLKPLIVAGSTSNTTYNWPEWALGGTKIIFTVRNGPPVSSADALGTYENIWEMNPDGSDRRQLTNYKFRAVQPKVSADGQSVIFAAENPQFPLEAIYKLNLLTLQATNLSQLTQPNGAADADPRWTPDGSIVMASNESAVPGEVIDELNADGTNRQLLINDGNYNTDPEISPDGSEIADSAFEGSNPVAPGATLIPGNPDDTNLNPQGWYIKVRNQVTGATTSLNQGEACDDLMATCQPGQSSGWQPEWSPDGGTVAWIGRLNGTTTCVCAANADGSDPRALIQSSTLVITWFDWTAPGGQAPSTAVTDSQIGSDQVPSRLLLSVDNLADNQSEILDEPVDMMGDDAAGTGSASDPTGGSWSQDRSVLVFVANASYNPNDPQYGPPPPPGQQVHEHFTLQELDPALPTYPADDIPASEQIFLRRSDGTVVQLTTPWTEDWRDAIDEGDLRSNTDPIISPNGQYVVFTNHSSLTGESFLLSMDLATGAVLNLTNGTAGAMQVNDALPAWSPDGSKIAFTWTEGANTDVFVMNASDGTAVTEVTDDDAYDMDPTWSPDGRSVVFSRYDGTLAPSPAELDSLVGLPTAGWSLVKVDVATGQESVLTTPADSPTWRPVYSPDGSQIDFIGWKYRTMGVFRTTPDGAPVEPLLITPNLDVTSVDWK